MKVTKELVMAKTDLLKELANLPQSQLDQLLDKYLKHINADITKRTGVGAGAGAVIGAFGGPVLAGIGAVVGGAYGLVCGTSADCKHVEKNSECRSL